MKKLKNFLNSLFQEYDIKINFQKDSIANKDAIKNKEEYSEFVKELNLINPERKFNSIFSKKTRNVKCKKILIYGGSSLISKELISIYYKEDYNFIIFCRKKELVLSYLVDLKLDNNKFKIFDIDLIDLQKNLELISKLEDNIDGVIWISGYTGDLQKSSAT